MDAFCFFLCLI